MRVRTVGGDPCKRAPPPKKAHWRNSALGVPATPTQTLDKKSDLDKEGTNPPPWRGFAGSHSSQGGLDHPDRPPRDDGAGLFAQRAQPQTQQKGGKQKQQRRIDANTFAALRPKKGPQRGRASSSPTKFRENPKTPKRAGPRMAPRKTPAKKRTARRGDNINAAGTKKRKTKRPTNMSGGKCG